MKNYVILAITLVTLAGCASTQKCPCNSTCKGNAARAESAAVKAENAAAKATEAADKAGAYFDKTVRK